MTGAKGIVRALFAIGEPRKAAGLAQGTNTITAPSQNLVRIGLVADVPNEAVVGRVKHPVERYRQLDDAKARAQVTARDRNGVDHFVAKLRRQLRQLILRQLAQLVGRCDLVEKRCLAHCKTLMRRSAIEESA